MIWHKTRFRLQWKNKIAGFMQFTSDNERSQNIWTGYLNYENGGMTYLAIFQTFDCMILAHFQEILQELRQEYAATWWQQKTGTHREGSKHFHTWRHKIFDSSRNFIFPMQSEHNFILIQISVERKSFKILRTWRYFHNFENLCANLICRKCNLQKPHQGEILKTDRKSVV